MVPDKSDVALTLLDVISDLEFEGAEHIPDYALPMADVGTQSRSAAEDMIAATRKILRLLIL